MFSSVGNALPFSISEKRCGVIPNSSDKCERFFISSDVDRMRLHSIIKRNAHSEVISDFLSRDTKINL